MLKELFDKIDIDKSGLIDKKEFTAFFKENIDNITENDINIIFK